MAAKYCIAVDWLEVCCYGRDLEPSFFSWEGKHFSVEQEDRETPLFRSFFEVKRNGLVWAQIRQNPKSGVMKKGLTIIKLSNRVLYHEKYVPFLMHMIQALGLYYKGLTRLDIAYDCNEFYCGRKPSRFVHQFVTKRVDEKGGMYVPRMKEFDFHLKKDIHTNGMINYLAIGAKGSKKRGYIYDKTLELQEVKDKPWIREMWERNGLISDKKTHVWRSEISIKAQGTDLLNLDTGQLFALHPNYLSTYENIKKIFHFYAAKVFDFRYNNGEKNRRDFAPLCLFDTSIDCTCLPKRVNVCADSGRSEKACKNKLEKLSRTYIDLSEDVRHSLAHAIAWIGNLSSIKAARYAAECQKHYLDTFACSKFMAEEDFAYLQACEELSSAKRYDDRVAELLYERYLSYTASKEYQDAFGL